MKSFISLFLGFGILCSLANADSVPPKAASKRISDFVKVITPLAESGVDEHKGKPTRSVREALLALSLKTGYNSEESEFNWVGKSNDAWEADSTNFGEESMKGAYDYVTELDESYEESLNEPGNEKEKAKVLAAIKKAKDSFRLLLNTGVMFGVAPMGAVQCGVTFAALAIIDPHTGKIYLFAKEGSGC